MKQDQQTYQRGVTAALIGGAVQLLVAAVVLVLGLWLDSDGVGIAAWHAFGGLGIWVVLAIVYQQHRLVRLEALESEELARTHGTQSSIFETSADELSVARRRLEMLQKWALPLVTLATAGYLLGVGTWQLLDNLPLLQAGPLRQDTLDVDPLLERIVGAAGLNEPLIVAAFFVAIAFVSFVVSRYIAGMGKVAEWSLLRGGAGYLMGTCLVAAGLTVGYGLMFIPTSFLLRWLVVIIPAFMILIGAEMLLNLLLNVYRPRRPGEMPKPAFDSRMLGLLTAPESIAKTINEAINYQFGFEITQSWAWQLFSRAFGYLMILAAGVLIAASSIVIVQPHEQAIITRFGQIVAEADPGLHVKWPWPISRAQRYDVTTVRQLRVGSAETGLKENTPILWANEHYRGEPTHLIVPEQPDLVEVGDSPAAGREADPAGLAADVDGPGTPPASGGAAADKAVASVSLVNVEMFVQWRIGKVRAFVTGNDDPVRRLTFIANQALTRQLFTRSIDEWTAGDRLDASRRMQELIQAQADAAGLGIEVVAVPLASVHPPQQVAEAFAEVLTAEQVRQTTIKQAQREAAQTMASAAGTVEQAQRIADLIELRNTLAIEAGDAEQIAELTVQIDQAVQAAGGEAAEAIASAQADRWRRENLERAGEARFERQLVAYRAAPEFFKLRMYLDNLVEGMAGARKFFLLADRQTVTLRFDFTDVAEGLGDILGNE